MVALHIIAWIFLSLGILSCIVVYWDINMGRYQSMPIMNLAWPITCLYSNVLGLFMYFKYGRATPSGMGGHAHHHDMGHAHTGKHKPHWVQIYISSTHCGAGCGIADIIAELLIFFAGITIFGHALFASYFIDYIFALAFGLAFQYFNIMPMRPELSPGQGLWAAVKADVWSLTSFQIGMYLWMLVAFYIFPTPLRPDSAIYWFMMQIGLTLGLLTTYPVNWWLIKTGVKVPCAH